jgi:hypothetical protein
LIIIERTLAFIGDENASSAPALLKQGRRAMLKRRRFKHTESLQDRLATFAKDARDKAAVLPAGPEREDWLKRARQADTASHIEDWANSTGLQPPTLGTPGPNLR